MRKAAAASSAPAFGPLLRLALESVGLRYVSVDLLRKAKRDSLSHVGEPFQCACSRAPNERSADTRGVRGAARGDGTVEGAARPRDARPGGL
jgi:hypothetical protein